jgi:uncharacterized LabA/DUF88 family protein
MLANYFFIDGSALTAQIRLLKRADKSFADRKLCPKRLIAHYAEAMSDLSSQEFKRATFYFPIGDEQTAEEYLVMPDHRTPGEIRDLHFKFCGQKLKKSAEFTEFVETQVPEKWKDRFSKSEKGIDIEMCCDAFKLASAARLERLFLFTNDDDFIPFCRMIKEFGANISIIHLTARLAPNHSLLQAADTYDVVSSQHLQQLFLPIPLNPPATEIVPSADAFASALKADSLDSEEIASDATSSRDESGPPKASGKVK